MARTSAGLLLFRERDGVLEVLLAHPGGPLWAKKDEGAWSIPKGEVAEGEDLERAALREFEEETGATAPTEAFDLGSVKQPGGKIVHAWAARGELDPADLRSNEFTLEWPPRSGRVQRFPEVDRVAWMALGEAERKILRGQVELLHRLRARIPAP
jgi:predicted NUDIX family NTP pyrophosphohydrolase